MHKKFIVVLWILVAVVVGAYALKLYMQPDSSNVADGEQSLPDGRVFETVSWKRFPAIQQFQLVERSGEKFDSSQLSGQPYLVSFFFARCPSICRDLNVQVKQLTEHFADSDITFVSISVDPENDTPQVLSDYADLYDADAEKWLFLTGKMHVIDRVGRQQFKVIIDAENHTGDILLVDRWGRFRDRFKWDDQKEIKRLKSVAQKVIAEEQPPLDQSFETRNVVAGISHSKQANVPWLNEFDLLDEHNQPFFSRDLTGKPWVASFFFSTCPGICPKQNEFLSSTQDAIYRTGAEIVSITTDPLTDKPAVLREYARKVRAKENWHWLTGEDNYIRRVSSEFFKAHASADHHSTMLFVVDRWGNVRGTFDWQDPAQKDEMLAALEELAAEQVPPAKPEKVSSVDEESP